MASEKRSTLDVKVEAAGLFKLCMTTVMRFGQAPLQRKQSLRELKQLPSMKSHPEKKQQALIQVHQVWNQQIQ